MKKIKKIILRTFFACEIIGFGCLYVFGARGVKNCLLLEQQNNKILTEIIDLQKEVSTLEVKIAKWHTYPFYKEKIAREQLQLASKDDLIYIVKNN